LTCRGGEEVLLDVGGQDSTEAFEDVGHSDEAREILEGLYVGTLKRQVCLFSLSLSCLEIVQQSRIAMPNVDFSQSHGFNNARFAEGWHPPSEWMRPRNWPQRNIRNTRTCKDELLLTNPTAG
jgi:hypothetical protein